MMYTPFFRVEETGAGSLHGGRERACLGQAARLLHVLHKLKVELELEAVAADVALWCHTLGQYCPRQICSCNRRNC